MAGRKRGDDSDQPAACRGCGGGSSSYVKEAQDGGLRRQIGLRRGVILLGAVPQNQITTVNASDAYNSIRPERGGES